MGKMKQVQKAGGIVLNNAKELLIITSNKGLLTIPKGGLESNETPLQAALREIYEESGLTKVSVIKEIGTIIRPGYSSDNDDQPTVEKHIIIFLCQTNEQKLQPVDKNIRSAEWVPIQKALKILSWPEEKLFLKKQLQNLFAITRIET